MKLRLNAEGQAVELEGTPSEMREYVSGLSEAKKEAPKPAVRGDVDSRGKTLDAKEVASYIESLGDPDLTHSFPQITDHFLGKRINSQKEILVYNANFGQLKRAHKILEAKTGRKFQGIRRAPQNGSNKARIMEYSLTKPLAVELQKPHMTIVSSP